MKTLKDLTCYTDYILQETERLLNIDSPTGYTEEPGRVKEIAPETRKEPR